LSEDQINQIILGLRGVQLINNSFQVDEPDVNNEKMASYSQVVSGNNGHQDNNRDDTDEQNNQYYEQSNTQSQYQANENVQSIFLKDEDVFGSHKPERSIWLTNVEIYKAIGDKVQPQCIKGIQRVTFIIFCNYARG